MGFWCVSRHENKRTETRCWWIRFDVFIHHLHCEEILQSHVGPRGGKRHDAARTELASQVYKQHFKSYFRNQFQEKSLFCTKQE